MWATVAPTCSRLFARSALPLRRALLRAGGVAGATSAYAPPAAGRVCTAALATSARRLPTALLGGTLAKAVLPEEFQFVPESAHEAERPVEERIRTHPDEVGEEAGEAAEAATVLFGGAIVLGVLCLGGCVAVLLTWGSGTAVYVLAAGAIAAAVSGGVVAAAREAFLDVQDGAFAVSIASRAAYMVAAERLVQAVQEGDLFAENVSEILGQGELSFEPARVRTRGDPVTQDTVMVCVTFVVRGPKGVGVCDAIVHTTIGVDDRGVPLVHFVRLKFRSDGDPAGKAVDVPLANRRADPLPAGGAGAGLARAAASGSQRFTPPNDDDIDIVEANAASS